MNTENTDTAKGWVLYDGDCALCRGWAGRVHGLLARRGYHLVPLQAEWVRARLGLVENAPLPEMKLLMADDRIHGGADALVQLARAIWWAWPAFAIAQIPGVKGALRRGYSALAARRHCAGNHCQVPRRTNQHSGISSAFYEIP